MLERRTFIAGAIASLFGWPVAAAPTHSIGGAIQMPSVDFDQSEIDDDFETGFWGEEAIKLPIPTREAKLREFLAGTNHSNISRNWKNEIKW